MYFHSYLYTLEYHVHYFGSAFISFNLRIYSYLLSINKYTSFLNIYANSPKSECSCIGN